ncbi:hypothetical protein [Collimonas fungivorans]|uniref:Neisseria meningitidis TspB family protein n=1 Tax=Collimonas fungivorans (strain Ter331) TaxID=1005048 RepID=G0AGW6_COLFT|nr:hypothetical protein [Collimonas fungivorans]AEK61971.1 hypothetical protein CFU_2141 [Collimonas fungivorans Ter331]
MNIFLLRALSRFCIIVMLLCFYNFAHASYSWTGSTSGGSSNGLYPDAVTACQSYAQPTLMTNFVMTVNTGNTRSCTWVERGTTYGASTGLVAGSVCTAPNVVDSKGACGPPVQTQCYSDPAGSHHDALFAGTGKKANVWPKKINGCDINITGLDDDCQGQPTSVAGVFNWYCGYEYNYGGTGSYAPDTPGPTAPKPVVPTTEPAKSDQPMTAPSPNPDNSCPAGTSNIGSDSAGTAMCSGNGTGSGNTKNTTTNAPPVTTNNSDGSTTTTNSSTSGNKDGSSTTITTTCTVSSAGGKSCTVSGSTSNNADGAPGKSDGKDATNSDPPGDDFCAKHPELNVCSNSQVGGTGCNGATSNTTISGDAIQGAILRKMRDDTCANLVASASKDLGNKLLGGADPMQSQIDQTKAGDIVDLSQDKLDQSGFLGGGLCLSDRNLSFAGHDVPIHLSAVCQNLLPLRYVIVSCALLVAYLIVSKSILQG